MAHEIEPAKPIKPDMSKQPERSRTQIDRSAFASDIFGDAGDVPKRRELTPGDKSQTIQAPESSPYEPEGARQPTKLPTEPNVIRRTTDDAATRATSQSTASPEAKTARTADGALPPTGEVLDRNMDRSTARTEPLAPRSEATADKVSSTEPLVARDGRPPVVNDGPRGTSNVQADVLADGRTPGREVPASRTETDVSAALKPGPRSQPELGAEPSKTDAHAGTTAPNLSAERPEQKFSAINGVTGGARDIAGAHPGNPLDKGVSTGTQPGANQIPATEVHARSSVPQSETKPIVNGESTRIASPEGKSTVPDKVHGATVGTVSGADREVPTAVGDRQSGATDARPLGVEKVAGSSIATPHGSEKSPATTPEPPATGKVAETPPGRQPGSERIPTAVAGVQPGSDKSPGAASAAETGSEKTPGSTKAEQPGSEKTPGTTKGTQPGTDRGPSATTLNPPGSEKVPGTATSTAPGSEKVPGTATSTAPGSEKVPGDGKATTPGSEKVPTAVTAQPGGDKFPGKTGSSQAGSEKNAGTAASAQVGTEKNVGTTKTAPGGEKTGVSTGNQPGSEKGATGSDRGQGTPNNKTPQPGERGAKTNATMGGDAEVGQNGPPAKGSRLTGRLDGVDPRQGKEIAGKQVETRSPEKPYAQGQKEIGSRGTGSKGQDSKQPGQGEQGSGPKDGSSKAPHADAGAGFKNEATKIGGKGTDRRAPGVASGAEGGARPTGDGTGRTGKFSPDGTRGGERTAGDGIRTGPDAPSAGMKIDDKTFGSGKAANDGTKNVGQGLVDGGASGGKAYGEKVQSGEKGAQGTQKNNNVNEGKDTGALAPGAANDVGTKRILSGPKGDVGQKIPSSTDAIASGKSAGKSFPGETAAGFIGKSDGMRGENRGPDVVRGDNRRTDVVRGEIRRPLSLADGLSPATRGIIAAALQGQKTVFTQKFEPTRKGNIDFTLKNPTEATTRKGPIDKANRSEAASLLPGRTKPAVATPQYENPHGTTRGERPGRIVDDRSGKTRGERTNNTVDDRAAKSGGNRAGNIIDDRAGKIRGERANLIGAGRHGERFVAKTSSAIEHSMLPGIKASIREFGEAIFARIGRTLKTAVLARAEQIQPKERTQPKETAQRKEPTRVADANPPKSLRPNVIDLRTTPIAKRAEIKDVSVTKPTLQQVRDNPNLETTKAQPRTARAEANEGATRGFAKLEPKRPLEQTRPGVQTDRKSSDNDRAKTTDDKSSRTDQSPDTVPKSIRDVFLKFNISIPKRSFHPAFTDSGSYVALNETSADKLKAFVSSGQHRALKPNSEQEDLDERYSWRRDRTVSDDRDEKKAESERDKIASGSANSGFGKEDDDKQFSKKASAAGAQESARRMYIVKESDTPVSIAVVQLQDEHLAPLIVAINQLLLQKVYDPYKGEHVQVLPVGAMILLPNQRDIADYRERSV